MQSLDDNSSKDILGLKAYGEALKIAVDKSFSAAAAVLSRICLPAAEELGLMMKDKMRYWRLNNIINIVKKTDSKLEFRNDKLELKVHPKIIKSVFDNASWEDSEEIQELWAGLIAASCDTANISDDNIIYTETLKQLTRTEARIINYWAAHSSKVMENSGQVSIEKGILMNASQFFEIVGSNNIDKLSSEISHMRGLDLVEQGYGLACGFFYDIDDVNKENLRVGLRISPLALILYVRGEGFSGNVKDFFKM